MFSVDPMALRHPAETPDLFTFYSGFTAPKLSKYDHGAARGSVVPTGTPALVCFVIGLGHCCNYLIKSSHFEREVLV